MPVNTYSLLHWWDPWAIGQDVSASAAPRSLYLTQALSCVQCPFFHLPASQFRELTRTFIPVHVCVCVCVGACAHTHTHTDTILKWNLHTWGNIGLVVQYYGFWKHPCFLSQLIFFTRYLIKSVPSSTSMIYPGGWMVLAYKGDWRAMSLAGFKVLTGDSWVTYACVLYFCHLGLVHSANQVGVIPFPVLSFQKRHRNSRGLWTWNWSCMPFPWDKNSLTTFSLQKENSHVGDDLLTIMKKFCVGNVSLMIKARIHG